MSTPDDPEPRPTEGDVPWRSDGDDAPPSSEAGRASFWRWADQVLTPGRLALLAGVSLLSTGLVIWAGMSSAPAGDIAALLLHRPIVVARAAAPAGSPASSSAPPPITAPTPTPSASASPSAAAAATTNASTASTPAPSGAAAGGGTGSSGARASSPARPSRPSSGATGATGATGASGAAPVQTKIKHVFIIVLAGLGYDQTWGPTSPATYLNTQLRPRGTLLSNFDAVAHPELPDYIAMVSGQPPNADTEQNCTTFTGFPSTAALDAAGVVPGSGCVYPENALTIGDQMTSSGHTWRAYIEDLANGSPSVPDCRHPNSDAVDPAQQAVVGDQYATRHNPFVYFHSLLDYGDCQSDDLPLTALSADLSSAAKTPNYSFIVPNLCDDGEDSPCVDGRPGGLASADAFLAQWVPLILASPAYKDGALIVTSDQGAAGDTSGCCTATTGATTGGGQVGALVVSPFAKAGATSATPYNDYSLLRTVEDLFGFAHLADAGLPGVHSFGSDVFPDVFPKATKR